MATAVQWPCCWRNTGLIPSTVHKVVLPETPRAHAEGLGVKCVFAQYLWARNWVYVVSHVIATSIPVYLMAW